MDKVQISRIIYSGDRRLITSTILTLHCSYQAKNSLIGDGGKIAILEKSRLLSCAAHKRSQRFNADPLRTDCIDGGESGISINLTGLRNFVYGTKSFNVFGYSPIYYQI